ncbi:sigma-54 dependent transcriptional regulator [Pelagibacteraceae bacterium]|nr:sigma-54 dependent transcriptional regulator [Pelagibacteraceae bacterium]
MHKVLIIDDEKDICFLISEILKDENYNTSIALNSEEAISKFNEIKPDLVILDVWLSNSKLDGIEILKEFKSINSNIPIIIISGHGTVDLAVKSIKNGAYDFLEKPFNSDKLIILTKRAIESSSLLSENKNLKDTLIKTTPLIGNSEFIKKINKLLNEQSSSNSRLLIEGPFGTGKKHFTNLIHQNSQYRDKLPISIDFKKLTNEALDNMFSENKDAINENIFYRSNNNTLILLNIETLPNIYQKKLLNFLENKKFFEDLDIKLNHKIITITEKNLEIEIEKGNFIKRLYDRISTDFIKFKSLSNRVDDVLPILDFYLNEKSGGILNFKFSSKALTKLQMYDWPGNISQLINYVEKSLILNQDQNIKELEVDDLALQMGDETASNSSNNSLDLSLKEARSEFEKNYLISQIKRFNGNITKVSEFTGMERTALYRKFKSLDIKVE